ncbi:MAG: metalloregulator ArsR/SmtB family transcription factor [Saccharofermentans sp.]|nr:metalloregulator ArsR/SmtB family transcription factor [Saccharofermentans sp.]
MKHNHAELLDHIKADMPADEILQDLGDLFKIFGDTTRIKIMYALYEDEMCVCAIAELISMTQSAVSHQLKALKAANLVASRREGKTIYYRLSDDHVKSIIAQGYEHITEK